MKRFLGYSILTFAGGFLIGVGTRSLGFYEGSCIALGAPLSPSH